MAEIKTITLPETGFMRIDQILQFIPVSRSGWWKGIRDGVYPKGIKMGINVTAWRVEDIRKLIEELGSEAA
ncbi:helix-turn-helix transcriptional regulator [Maridesulfovibrio sp.]|uniref:helix-turn-helix transcriptional regulator n=1 Tax=Maridesulfovibrio sp. TaxID=2795000 RepID=UPI003BAD9ECF